MEETEKEYRVIFANEDGEIVRKTNFKFPSKENAEIYADRLNDRINGRYTIEEVEKPSPNNNQQGGQNVN